MLTPLDFKMPLRKHGVTKATPAKGPSQETNKKHSDIKYTGAPNTLEKEFLEGFQKGRVAISIGTKNSGKSYLSLHYLKDCFDKNCYDQYFIVASNFDNEQNDSYAFIKKYKGNAKITVFNAWDNMIIERIKKEDHKKRKFLFIDDASGHFSMYLDNEVLQFVSSIRHHNCSMWAIFHVLRSGIPSTLRAQIDYFFIFLNTNRSSLQSMWEELASLVFPTFKEFLEYYKKEVLAVQYNCLLIYTREVGKLDPKVKTWRILQKDI